MKDQITIKDLARELGISPSTVSRALKDHPDISAKTKKMVSDLAKKLDYQPNSIALSLRSSKTNTIGVIIPELVHFFFSTVISGIEDVAYDEGYNVILCQSNESHEREIINAHALLSHRVDGLLVSVSKESKNFDHLQSFQDRNLPMIFFDRIAEGIHASSVVVDDRQGAYKAVAHLIEQGCRRILHLAAPPALMISTYRKQGYMDALRDAGLPRDPDLIQYCHSGSNVEEADEIVSGLIHKGVKFDGIFANNDLTAIGAMNVLKRNGLRIPEDVAVVGFSNWQMAALVEPALSSVTQPGFEMGQTATRLFIEQLNYPSTTVHRKVVLETDLIIRESSKRR